MTRLPTVWYNIVPDLPRPLPPPRDPFQEGFSRIRLLPEIFPHSLLDQEFSAERWIEIPSDVLEVYQKLGRPTPLVRAKSLERYLKTPARIYYKREELSPTGSHKVNTSIAQAYYAKKEGVKVLATETSAGQWGTALAFASALFGLKCLVFMTRASYVQKPYRRVLMSLYGAEVVPSPSKRTEIGSNLLRRDKENPGSLGIAISEAIEAALKFDETKYAVGSVMNFVILHQTVIGLESIAQLEVLEEVPDVLIACVGGGSNFGGFSFPFIGKKLAGKGYEKTRFVAVESKASPKITKGSYRYEHADMAGYLPMLKMYTVGRDFIPPPFHAAGLRYHAVAPTISLLIDEGIVEPVAYTQDEVLEAAKVFAHTEGIVVAPETAHAVKHVIEEALAYKRENKDGVIVFCLSGHGLLDLVAYK